MALKLPVVALATFAVCLLLRPAVLSAETTTPSLAALVQLMVDHELADREKASYWMYHVEKTTDGQTKSEEQVETRDGPIFRVLAIDGQPLDAKQQSAEDERIQNLLHDPAAQRKVKQAHEADEQRVRQLLTELPKAFLYTLDGMENNNIRLRFAPNPEYSPPNFQSRPLRSVEGTLVVEPHQVRLVRLDGHLVDDVEFGYGILGKVDKGGTFSIARQAVSPTHWRTRLVDVHVSGRIVLFKSIEKQQHDARWDFHQVPTDLTLAQAVTLLQDWVAKHRTELH
jgi:hypothetical protein